jgi:hypothetical protein
MSQMKAAGLVVVCGLFYAVSAGAQTQNDTQAGVAASGQTSAQASPHGAQASANGTSTANRSAEGAQGGATLAGGTAFNATLDKPIDSKKCKPGEPVTAHTTEPVKSGGKTIIPKGTKMMGHVTQASARANGQADSQLGIVFDKAVMKNGQEMPMNVAIQALGAASGNASAATDNMELAGGGAAHGGGSAAAGGGRGGALGGVTSTAGGLTHTATGAGNAVGGTLNSATQTTTSAAGSASNGATGTLNTAGQFTSNSRGVFGMNGLDLNSASAAGAQGSLITSAGKNVHLDSGTRMLLVSQASASATH